MRHKTIKYRESGVCGHPGETIDHHLLYCAPLADLRAQFLPTQLNKENLLYGHPEQLQNTCKYHYMALDRRAKVQTAAG